MKKFVLMIVVGMFLVVGTFGISSAAWWRNYDLTIVRVGETLNGVEVQCTWAGQAAGINFFTDPVSPPATKNSILAILLTAVASGKSVRLQFEGNYIVGARIIN